MQDCAYQVSMVGGGLMVVVGLAYLLHEDFVLSDFGISKAKKERLHTSRTLLGVQVIESLV